MSNYDYDIGITHPELASIGMNEKIASAIHPYPTLSEINKKVVGSIFSPKIFSDTVRKGLKFFFSFKGRACTCGQDIDCDEGEK
jgi:hypothetical protein